MIPMMKQVGGQMTTTQGSVTHANRKIPPLVG